MPDTTTGDRREPGGRWWAGRGVVLATALAVALALWPASPGAARPSVPEVVAETLDTVVEASRLERAGEPVRRSEVIEGPLRFSGVGIRGEGPAPQLRVRTHDVDEGWSPWVEVEILDEYEGPDPDSAEARRASRAAGGDAWTTEAIWTGEATHAQVEVVRGSLDDLEVTLIDAMGYSESLLSRLGRAARSLMPEPEPADAASRPSVIRRSEWGADESWRRGSPSHANVRFGVLHHTATTNDYSRAQAAGQVRNIYYWHTRGNGWNDIGYNFLVDRFGRIYEGRAGGMERGVVGAHAAGWNTGSVGVAVLGNYNSAAPSSDALDATARLLAWQYRVHGIDPDPSARVHVNGHRIRTLEGHRNLRSSYIEESNDASFARDCPGANLYAQMPGLRRAIASSAGPIASLADPGAWIPVTGDFDRDGRDSAGWFRQGRWRLSDATGPLGGSEVVSFSFGRAGDLPVVGDFDGDGRDTAGVFRDGTWYLSDSMPPSGAAEQTFTFGRAGDLPVVGDFNGDGRDTVGVVRQGTWHLRHRPGGGSADERFTFGRAGDQPVVGNWDGVRVPLLRADGIGVRRGNQWLLRDTPGGGSADRVFRYGRAGDLAVVGDWEGLSLGGVVNRLRDGVGVVRGDTWHLRSSGGSGAADRTLRFGP